MQIINFIEEHWALLGVAVSFFVFAWNMIQATKCSLRNDILSIYENAKTRGDKITRWELEAIEHSAEVYFKLRGNSFVKSILDRVKKFEIID